jgi:hypothetical protein
MMPSVGTMTSTILNYSHVTISVNSRISMPSVCHTREREREREFTERENVYMHVVQHAYTHS